MYAILNCPEQQFTEVDDRLDVPETFTLKELADEARESLGQAYSSKPRVRRKKKNHPRSN
jgi:hypothetical protein